MAERLFDSDGFADRNRLAADAGFADAELGFRVTPGDADEEFAAGRDLAAEGGVGKRTERMAEHAGVHAGPHLPGRQRRVTHFVQGVEQINHSVTNALRALYQI